MYLEKIDPNPSNIPPLGFSEMVAPFARQQRTESISNQNRSVNLNPLQTRYFEIVFMYEGLKLPHIELCFVGYTRLLPAGEYTLGLRAAAKNISPEYREFEVSVTDEKRLRFGPLLTT